MTVVDQTRDLSTVLGITDSRMLAAVLDVMRNEIYMHPIEDEPTEGFLQAAQTALDIVQLRVDLHFCVQQWRAGKTEYLLTTGWFGFPTLGARIAQFDTIRKAQHAIARAFDREQGCPAVVASYHYLDQYCC